MTYQERIDKWLIDPMFLIGDVIENNPDAIYDHFDNLDYRGIYAIDDAKRELKTLYRNGSPLFDQIINVPFLSAGSTPITQAYIAYLIQRANEGNNFTNGDPLYSTVAPYTNFIHMVEETNTPIIDGDNSNVFVFEDDEPTVSEQLEQTAAAYEAGTLHKNSLTALQWMQRHSILWVILFALGIVIYTKIIKR